MSEYLDIDTCVHGCICPDCNGDAPEDLSTKPWLGRDHHTPRPLFRYYNEPPPHWPADHTVTRCARCSTYHTAPWCSDGIWRNG